MTRALYPLLLAGLFSLNLVAQEIHPNPPADQYDETHRFVFYAVLEGCFDSGVTQEEIDLIIPVRPSEEGRRNITANLVYTCPLCSPAFDAFRLYSDRRIFISGISEDAAYNTFGPGLTQAQKAALRAGGRERRAVIQELIAGWIDNRIEAWRLDSGEEQQLRGELTEMREAGEAALAKIKAGEMGRELQEIYIAREGCPVCSGAAPAGSGK
ncbi:MAG: hypothetical protein AAGD22_05385 [Verrucomicrobiota bacterium]